MLGRRLVSISECVIPLHEHSKGFIVSIRFETTCNPRFKPQVVLDLNSRTFCGSLIDEIFIRSFSYKGSSLDATGRGIDMVSSHYFYCVVPRNIKTACVSWDQIRRLCTWEILSFIWKVKCVWVRRCNIFKSVSMFCCFHPLLTFHDFTLEQCSRILYFDITLKLAAHQYSGVWHICCCDWLLSFMPFAIARSKIFLIVIR